MYRPAPGRDLTPDIARELDDTYLSSNPFGYFQSRIAALAGAAGAGELGHQAPHGEVGTRLHAYLQRPVLADRTDPATIAAQVAADAFSLRQHVAEALCRLALVALKPDDSLCAWSAVATGPVQVKSLLSELKELNRADPTGKALWRATVPPRATEEHDVDLLLAAANVFAAWLTFATRLLAPGEIDLQAAHNKVKHGLSVRARYDLRGTLTLGKPNVDGSIPLSAFDPSVSVDMFEHPVLEFLAQAPVTHGKKQGLEVTQVSLNTAGLLAQSYMLAWTHGAMFSVLAHRTFDQRSEALSDHVGPPDFPGFPWGGPTPDHIGAKELVGWRFPITHPPGGGVTDRPCGVVFPETFLEMKVDWENVRRGQVVADDPN